VDLRNGKNYKKEKDCTVLVALVVSSSLACSPIFCSSTLVLSKHKEFGAKRFKLLYVLKLQGFV
jgi:hypothetical protein